MKLSAVIALLAATAQATTLEEMTEKATTLDAQLKAMEDIDSAPIQDDEDVEEDTQMMDFEDQLDAMEDAFEKVQNEEEESELVDRRRRHRKRRPCTGTPAFVKICNAFRANMKKLRKEKREIRNQMRTARKYSRKRC
jgi:hypothetical protein